MDRAFKDAKSQLEQALKALQGAHSLEMEKVRQMALEAMMAQSPKKKTAAEVVVTGTQQLMPPPLAAQQEAFRLVTEVRALRADLATEVRRLGEVETIIIKVQAPAAPAAPAAVVVAEAEAAVAVAAVPKKKGKTAHQNKKKVSELEAQTEAEVLERCILGLQTEMDQALKENRELSRKLAEQQQQQLLQQQEPQQQLGQQQPQATETTLRKLKRQVEVEHRRAERLEAELLKTSMQKADDGRREKELHSLRTDVQMLQLQVALIPEKDAIIADQLKQLQQIKLHLEYCRIMESCSQLYLPEEPAVVYGPPPPPPQAGGKKKPHTSSSRKHNDAALLTLAMTDPQVIEALQQIYHNTPYPAAAAK